MSFTRATVRNRHAVWALSLAAAIFGALAYGALPMQLFPNTAPPMVNVITAYPGASAEDAARDLSEPLAAELASIEGIVNVRTTSQDNLSVISLELHYDRASELAAIDVQNAIARIRDTLPAGIAEPQVFEIDASNRPVVTLGVSAPDLRHARRLAEDAVAPRLQRVPGVAAVDVFGGASDAVLIELDPRRLEAHRIPFARVLETVRAHNAARPAGAIRTETSRVALRVEARVGDLAALAALPLRAPDGSRVLLADLGTVRRGTLDDDAAFSIDGARTIAVQVLKSEDANTVEVVHAALAAVDELRARHPDVVFSVGEESASFTELSIDNLLENVWQALLLAAAIIFLFLGRLRTSLVVAVSMPLSFGIAFGMMLIAGVQLDMVTLSALILAVGMVVDASVVVIENIHRRRTEDGLGPEDAAIAGTDEVRLPVLAGAATTLIVLVPLLFLAGFVGKTFGPLAATLLFAFLSSVVVALALVPVLSLYTGGEGRLDRAGQAIARPFAWAMDRLRDAYLALLSGALRFRLLTVAVALASFVGGVGAIASRGMDVLPKMDGGSFFVSLETPSGTSLEQTRAAVSRVEAVLADEPEVVMVQSQVGFEPGMRSMSSTGAQGPTQGFLSVTLTPRTARAESIWSIQDRVRARIARIPGIRAATVRELGNTAKSTTVAPIVVRISGPDPLVLDRLGDEVLARLSAVPALLDPVRAWRLDQRRYRVRVDRERAEALGQSPATVAALMQLGSIGGDAGDFDGDGPAVPIRVRYPRDPSGAPDDLLDYPILVPGADAATPLRAVATLDEETGPALLTSEDFTPTLEVTATVRDGALSFAVADARAALAGQPVPRGYQVELSGENRDLGEARRQLGGALALAIVAVYLLLVAQMRSFLHPLTILMSIPLSLSGVGIALWITGKPVSMPVMIALILLVGIVVNNAIILIDFIRQRQQAGDPRRAALLASVRTRFRPIMMTSLSTIVGMIPLAAEWALGAERFSPLAIAVIGGMTAATFLTLIVIPVLYDLLDSAGERLRRRRPPGGTDAGPPAGGLRRAAAVVVVLACLAVGAAPAAAGEPLTLDLEQSLVLARRHSFALQAAEERVGAAEARHRQARGRLFPRLDANAGYARLSEVEPRALELPMAPGAEPVTFGEPITNAWWLRAGVTQPLFDLGAIRRTSAARAGVVAAEHAAARDQEELLLQVTEAYFALLRARELERAAGASAAALSAHLARVRALEAAGRTLPLDVARVETRLAQAEVSLAALAGQREVARMQLSTLLGLPASTELRLAEPPVSDPAEPSSAADTLTAAALASRSDLRLARAVATAREREASAAHAALWPRLLARAEYNLANPNERYVPPASELHGTWSASLLLSWSLDWGITAGRAAEARHEAAAVRHEVAALADGTRVAVARRHSERVAAERTIAAAQHAVDTAAQAMEHASRLFEAGRVDSAEVLEREADLTSARAQHAEAIVARHLAEARLQRLLGRAP